jgi:hypothetical protein
MDLETLVSENGIGLREIRTRRLGASGFRVVATVVQDGKLRKFSATGEKLSDARAALVMQMRDAFDVRD